MGIELELRQRNTVVRRSYEHGETLALALDTLVPPGQGRLSQIDPYRDTRFTESDAQAALPEIAALVDKCTSPFQEAALLDLAEMLEACATTPGGCLWFIGD
ncbi:MULTISPECIES: hypothetical protein [Streptomyces]|uniref:hypothetical protein n=1 Tax=Streptomyces TaxID=1883 RepID=UPI00167AD08C|nr:MULTISPECIES: hypothetical protein [Streptomyces]MBK3521281.1 hypothetical protein [Streptomyces sp. MBT70]GGS11289.1 hypothetical protein GCM10010236_77200 [Streptomyces eurythermus]